LSFVIYNSERERLRVMVGRGAGKEMGGCLSFGCVS